MNWNKKNSLDVLSISFYFLFLKLNSKSSHHCTSKNNQKHQQFTSPGQLTTCNKYIMLEEKSCLCVDAQCTLHIQLFA